MSDARIWTADLSQ